MMKVEARESGEEGSARMTEAAEEVVRKQPLHNLTPTELQREDTEEVGLQVNDRLFSSSY